MNNIVYNFGLEELSNALSVAESVFAPDDEARAKYHNPKEWEQKLKNGGFLTVAKDGQNPVGFVICYKKPNSLHIWNAGTLSEYRGQGIWNRMFESIVKFAKDNGYKRLTLNTQELRFPSMYAFCQANGFQEYDSEILPDGSKKTCFDKSVQ